MVNCPRFQFSTLHGIQILALITGMQVESQASNQARLIAGFRCGLSQHRFRQASAVFSDDGRGFWQGTAYL